ncbi:hypothetical protein [Streptomyces syringium]|uniref:hypothetical protein n=1 Tax=Streptomyces syringium TaxID=76729 RepID=UPI0037D5A9D4
MATLRNAIGSLVALAGVVAIVWSPFRPWYGDRRGKDYLAVDLFRADGVTGDHARLVSSLLAPMLITALVTLMGLVLRSRLLVGLTGLVVLALTVLWAVRQGQAAGSLTVGARGEGLNTGVATAAVGGAALLLAALVMPGRRPRHADAFAPAPIPEPPPSAYEPIPEPPVGAYDPYGDPSGTRPPAPGPYDDPSGTRPPAPYDDPQEPYDTQPLPAPPSVTPPPWPAAPPDTR